MTIKSYKCFLNVHLLQGDTEEEITDEAREGCRVDVELVPQVKVEEDTSTSGLSIKAFCKLAVGGKPRLLNLVSILVLY